jgi:hypothetical protein
MGIPPGARLVHPRAPEMEVRVVDDDRLTWRGGDHALTSLTKTLTREIGLPTSRDLRMFDGRSLGVAYKETYRGKAKAGLRAQKASGEPASFSVPLAGGRPDLAGRAGNPQP